SDAGFKNISTDLIYQLPQHDKLDASLQAISSLPLSHVSTYALTIESGTPFYQRFGSRPPDDEKGADQAIKIREHLEGAGFQRYEVSNYSRPGYESRHNLAYWNHEPYI